MERQGKRRLSRKERKDLKRLQKRAVTAGSSSSSSSSSNSISHLPPSESTLKRNQEKQLQHPQLRSGDDGASGSTAEEQPPKKKRKNKHSPSSSSSSSHNEGAVIYQDFMAVDDGLDTATKLFELANIPVVGYRCSRDIGAGSSSSSSSSSKKSKKSKKKDASRRSTASTTPTNSSAAVVWIRQDPAVVECTGGVLWETAFLLSTFLLNDADYSPILLRGAGAALPTVLELGAGCGLVALAAGEAGCAAVTTEAPPAMDNLAHNVKANRKLVKAGGGKVKAMPLSWGNADDAAAVRIKHGGGGGGTFDLIVGTDVVFNVALVQPLLATMREFSHAGTKAYLCLQERCAAAHKELLATAGKHFVVRDLSSRLPMLAGCKYAKELECHLFEFTLKKD